MKTEIQENAEFNYITDDVPEYSNTSLNTGTPSSIVEPYVIKRKIRKVSNELDRANEEWLKQKELKSDRARKMFLLSLLPDVESLTEEQMRKFRIKVLLLLEDIQGAPQ
uniref:BESS domain-containing protein n=1 Tax=Heliothis virescens TaxID=7102 RepID=A0A2A4JBW1_HELVI